MLFCVGCIILHHYTSQCVSVCITTTKKKIVVTLRRYYDREHTDLGGRLTFIDFTYFFHFYSNFARGNGDATEKKGKYHMVLVHDWGRYGPRSTTPSTWQLS